MCRFSYPLWVVLPLLCLAGCGVGWSVRLALPGVGTMAVKVDGDVGHTSASASQPAPIVATAPSVSFPASGPADAPKVDPPAESPTAATGGPRPTPL